MKTEFDLTLSNSIDTSNETAKLKGAIRLDSKETNSIDEQDNENTNSNSSDKFEKNFKRKIRF